MLELFTAMHVQNTHKMRTFAARIMSTYKELFSVMNVISQNIVLNSVTHIWVLFWSLPLLSHLLQTLMRLSKLSSVKHQDASSNINSSKYVVVRSVWKLCYSLADIFFHRLKNQGKFFKSHHKTWPGNETAGTRSAFLGEHSTNGAQYHQAVPSSIASHQLTLKVISMQDLWWRRWSLRYPYPKLSRTIEVSTSTLNSAQKWTWS